MSNPKAVEGGSFGGGGGGRPPLDLEGLLGDGGGGKPGGLKSWFGKFTQSQTRQRRQSVGFEAQVGIAPLISMDEDSNSHDISIQPTQDTSYASAQGGDSSKQIPFGRKRDLSFSDMQTPGGDGDTFLMNYKRKPSIDYSADDSPKTLLTLQQNNTITFELDKTSPKDSFSSMKTIHEGKQHQQQQQASLNIDESSVSDMLHLQGMELDRQVKGTDKNCSELNQEKNSSSIFLIDLETEKDGDKIKLVPKTKKFTVSNLLQKEWAQNWFFRNDSAYDDNAVSGTEEEGGEKKKRKTSADKHSEEKNKKSDEDDHSDGSSIKPSFVGKIKKAVEDHPMKYREMNTWQPQSQ